MISDSDLNPLSREELYSVIKHLNREIESLKTDLIKSKLLSDCYQIYISFFKGITETIEFIQSNNEVLDLLTKIKSLNTKKQCFVSLKRLESETSLNEILSKEAKPDPKGDDNSVICEDNPSDALKVCAPDCAPTVRTIVVTSNQNIDYNSKKRFEVCLRSDCKQRFTDSLRLHTLHKHNLRSHQKKVTNTEEDNNSASSSTDPRANPVKREICSENSTPEPKLIEIEEYGFEGSDRSLPHKKSFFGRHRQLKNETNVKIKCLWSGCEEWFTHKRDLRLHSLMKHQLKIDSKSGFNDKSTDPISGSKDSETFNGSTNLKSDTKRKSIKKENQFEESHTEVNGYSNKIDICLDNDSLDSQEFSNYESMNESMEESMEEQSVLENTAQNNEEEEAGDYFDEKIVKIEVKSENPFICDFEGCGFQTVNQQRLNNHKIRHSNETPFSCMFCIKQSKSISLAKAHLLAVHPEECPEYPYMECPQNGCEYKTKHNSNMLRHKMTHTLPIVCEYCDMGFANNDRLREHLPSHTGARDHVCPFCNKAYKTPSQLSLHKKHHNKTIHVFVCKVKGCKKSFVLETRFQKHMTLHNRKHIKN